MTKLEAVIKIITQNGQRPVSALDTGGASYVSEAERLLDEIDLEVQSREWHYNTFRDVELTPDNADKIQVPAATINIDTDDTDAWRDVTRQGDHLFDHDNNTDEFDGPLTVRYSTRFTFPCIPFPIADYIVAAASLRMCENYHPEQRIRLINLRAERDRALAAANRFNSDTTNANCLNSPDARRFRGRPDRRRRNVI